MKRKMLRSGVRSALSTLLLFAVLVCLDWGFRRMYRFPGMTGLGERKLILAFTLGWSGFLTALTALLPGRLRKAAVIVTGTLFSLVVLTHGALYQLFGHFFRFSDMNYMEDGVRFFSITYFTSLRKLFLLMVALAIAGSVVSALLLPKEPWRRRQLLAIPAAALCLGCVFLAHNSLYPHSTEMGWAVNYRPDDPSSVYKAFNDPNKCLHLTGLYQYTARDLYQTLGFEKDTRSWAELDAYFEQRAGEISGDTEMTNALEGRNLVMIMMESMDSWLVRPEYMPNLCAVKSQGIDFVNHFTPLFLKANTFCTEFISQTGLLPSELQEITAYPTNDFPLSLAHLFRGKGYSANSFHGANPAIYSRGPIHQNLGFEAYHNHADMDMDDYMLDSQLVWAFDSMVSDQPFFTYIITYSGHGPYTESFDNIAGPHMEAARAAVAASGVTGTPENMEEYTRAVAHAMETDAFIGAFMDALRESGHDADTAVLLYTDHYDKYMSDKEFLAGLKGTTLDSHDLYRTPCILWSADVTPRQVTKYTSTTDIVPTIIKLFGLDADCRYFVGDDMFGTAGGFAVLPGYEFAAPAGADWFAEAQRRTDASNDTLSSNYFASWNQ